MDDDPGLDMDAEIDALQAELQADLGQVARPTHATRPGRGRRSGCREPRTRGRLRAAPRRRTATPLARREARQGLLFISPWIIGFLAFTLAPDGRDARLHVH